MPSVYTQLDLAQRVLVRLGETGFGQSTEPEALKRVTDALPGLMAEFHADGIYAFPLDEDVPAAAFDALSNMVASKLSDDFGLPADAVQLLAGRAQASSELLRRLRYAGGFRARRSGPDYF
ncbi:hypothetical protein [Methylobacterium sp. Gmos1]